MDGDGHTVHETGDGPLLPAKRIGDYRLVAELGRGRTGRVFLGKREGLERTFAIKLLEPGLTETQVARAERGAQAVANLHHPGIVRAVEIGRHEGRLFMVMEHVPGETLAARLRRGPLPWGEAARLVIATADAVAVAHRAGVIHRDISPSNIVIDRRDGQPRVLDFGLARDVHPSADLTQKGSGFLGTPAYMGPEQVRGEPGDARTDVYALAAVLYEAVAGRPPINAATLDQLCVRILEEQPAPLRQRAPRVPAEVDAVVMRALSKERERRPSDAAELARELRSLTSGGATSLSSLRLVIGAPSAGLVSAVVVVCALLIGATVWASWEHGRRLQYERAARDASRAHQDAADSAEALAAEKAALQEQLGQVRGELAVSNQRYVEVKAELDERAAAEPPAPTPGASGAWSDEEVGALIDAVADGLARPRHPIAQRAKLLHDRGRFLACLALIERARKDGDRDPYLLVLKTRTLFKQGNTPAGQQALRQVLSEAPRGSPERLFARVIAGDPAGPELLERALKASPRDGYLRIFQAKVLRSQARVARSPQAMRSALSAAEEAVRLDPVSYQAYMERALIRLDLWELGGRRGPPPIAAAVADLRKVRGLQADPQHWSALRQSALRQVPAARLRRELAEALP